MANLNKVLLLGNVTRDPEVRYTPKGSAVCDLGIAVNRAYTTDSGEKREEVGTASAISRVSYHPRRPTTVLFRCRRSATTVRAPAWISCSPRGALA